MADPPAIISTNATGQPEIGPEIDTVLRGVVTKKPRVVLGWNHQNDTPNGLQSGKVWCFVSEGDHLKVFDENFNRSPKAGHVRFCGVANFTMVRMFHPYWAHYGRAPRDMHIADKRRCRTLYRQLIRRFHHNNRADDDEPETPADVSSETEKNRPKKRGRPSKRSKGGRAPRPHRRPQRSRQAAPVITGVEQQVAGYGPEEPMTISDPDDSDWNDYIPLVQRSRPVAGALRLGDMDNTINSIFGNTNHRVARVVEDVQEISGDEVKTEVETEELRIANNAAAAVLTTPRARSIVTPPLNASSNETTQTSDAPQMNRDDVAALLQLDTDENRFDQLRNALEDITSFTGEMTQETTRETNDGDNFKSGLEDGATLVEPEDEVKKDEDRTRTWVPCLITPITEVIVIDD